MKGSADIAIVVIGRNEGARLVACLASLRGQFSTVVYVDSASTDDSVKQARLAGASVVELDHSQPFSAARGRNAGFAALSGQDPEFVQFIDGDCILQPDWLAPALAAMREQTDLGIVTGWRAEINPKRSLYNALCDFEWRRPAGDILTCGGDMLVRSTAFQDTGGFNAVVIAAEDDEFCVRIRKSGWRIHRLPIAMTRHDANMTRFSQWWQRAVRSGHGFAQVGTIHPDYFIPERRRVVFYGGALPILALVGLLIAPWLFLLVLGLYGLSYLRTVMGLQAAGLPPVQALKQATLLSLSKLPNLQGLLVYYWRRLRRINTKIIEYK